MLHDLEDQGDIFSPMVEYVDIHIIVNPYETVYFARYAYYSVYSPWN